MGERVVNSYPEPDLSDFSAAERNLLPERGNFRTLSAPVTLQWEQTPFCNERCVHRYTFGMDVKVAYSLDLDAWNYLRSVFEFTWLKHGRNNLQGKLFQSLPQDFQKALKETKNKNQARIVIKSFLSRNLKGRRIKYREIGKKLTYVWEKEGREIENKLQNLYEREIPFKVVKIYLSSLPICPYNYEKRWIMVFAEVPSERQLQIITHELNHFMFYYYFGELRGDLGKEKFESLKEALTVFTNPEEKGYPAQQKLRQWLAKQKKSIPEIIRTRAWRRYL